LKVIGKGRIETQYYPRVFLTGLVILIATPFHLLDFFWYRKKIKEYRFSKDPLFIIGHWRSGTTLLHNCLCQDTNSGYLTTYHSLFPNNVKSKFIFKTLTRMAMPTRRPSDNMELNASYPQEDELALGNIHSNFYYNFFYFPSAYRDFYDKAVQMNVQVRSKESWKKAYINLMKKASMNTNGKRMIIKNPVNTARISTILEMFPDAKFLFIYRNPLTVYFSTQRFFYSLLPTLWLHKVDMTFIDEMILDVYVRLMDDYNAQKQLIPKGNLMELKFEAFEENPLDILRIIYADLLGEDFGRNNDAITRFLNAKKNYKKNFYTIEKKVVDSVSQHLEEYMQKWNYSVPEDIQVC
jgi:hypothetical protein